MDDGLVDVKHILSRQWEIVDQVTREKAPRVGIGVPNFIILLFALAWLSLVTRSQASGIAFFIENDVATNIIYVSETSVTTWHDADATQSAQYIKIIYFWFAIELWKIKEWKLNIKINTKKIESITNLLTLMFSVA